MLKAKVGAGHFTFSPTSLTVVCGGNHDAPVTISCATATPEPYSVAGDCIEWNYDPTFGGAALFNTCVRMARADYLGNGWSATRFGTRIQPYAGNVTDLPSCFLDCDSCFEAYWYERGAFCINHQRWESLLQNLVAVVGLTLEDARKVLDEHFPVHLQPPGQAQAALKEQTTVNLPVTVKERVSASKKAAERELAEAAASLMCIDGATGPKLLSLALLRNRSRINYCSGGVAKTEACGNAQGGLDPACQAQCP